MAEIVAAIDEDAANSLFDTALALIPPLSDSGTGNLGPFTASYSVSVTFTGGDVDLIPPGTIRIADFVAHWHIGLTFQVDLSDFLPDFCLPQVCVDIPCVGEVCTPKICIDWPTITVPVSFGDFLKVTADFGLAVQLNGGNWQVKAVVQGVPNLQFGPTTAGLLVLIGAAITPVLLLVPFIGPFLAGAVNLMLLAISIAGLTGFLGPILSPFVAGLEIDVYDQPAIFPVLPTGGPFDPPVNVKIDAVNAEVTGAGEDELVVSADISA
jgi:hypothetical protein